MFNDIFISMTMHYFQISHIAIFQIITYKLKYNFIFSKWKNYFYKSNEIIVIIY